MIDIWLIRFDALFPHFSVLEKSLSDKERIRCGRYVFEDDRIRATLTRGAVRRILGHYTSVAAADISFSSGQYGKPFISGNEIEFSISHTKRHFGLAVSTLPVGLDIEDVIDEGEANLLAGAILQAHELIHYRQLSNRSAASYLTRAWTEKESVIKATGHGLSCPLDVFELRPLDASVKIALFQTPPSKLFVRYLGTFDNAHLTVCAPTLFPLLERVGEATPHVAWAFWTGNARYDSDWRSHPMSVFQTERAGEAKESSTEARA